MSKATEVLKMIEDQVEILGNSRLKTKCYETLMKCCDALVDLEMEL